MKEFLDEVKQTLFEAAVGMLVMAFFAFVVLVLAVGFANVSAM